MVPNPGSTSPSGLKLGPGVYRLIAKDRTIPRACGDDNSGTLYIGQTGALDGRIGELRKTLRPQDWKSGSHGAGKLLRETAVLSAKFSVEILATVYALSETPFECEDALIRAYVNQFGEGPPLNRQRSLPTFD